MIGTPDANGGRAFRIAHLSDIHIQPERGAAEGVAACLRHIHALPDGPDLIINGGDAIMDATGTDYQRAVAQWDLFDATLREHCHLPMVHCIGNHDIWGWNRRKSECTGDEPLFGKALAQQRLGLSAPYYAFERAGWRFLVLDSSFDSIGAGQPASAASFTARLDDAQFSWLTTELLRTSPGTPIVIVSHCPIIAGASLFFTGGAGETERTGNWVIPSAWMHQDARAIVALLMRFPNVRLCLSGHTHLHDRTEYAGITFINNGAVSGRWWRNKNPDPIPTYDPPGYGLLDFYSDGTFKHQWVAFPIPAESEG